MPQLKTFAIRLPDKAVKELKETAQAQYIPTRTMIRAWIMQRLETERMNKIPAGSAELAGTTLNTGAQTHQNGVIADVN